MARGDACPASSHRGDWAGAGVLMASATSSVLALVVYQAIWMRDSISLTWRQHRKGASDVHSVQRLCVRGLHRFRMHLRLPARERAPVGEPVMHDDTGLLAVVGSLCLMLARCLAGVRSSQFVKKCFPIRITC